MTRLLRSLIVAARWFAPLSFKGFRHSARLGRISPPGWSLLPGAPALTRTGLAPARTTRLQDAPFPHRSKKAKTRGIPGKLAIRHGQVGFSLVAGFALSLGLFGSIIKWRNVPVASGLERRKNICLRGSPDLANLDKLCVRGIGFFGQKSVGRRLIVGHDCILIRGC